MIKEYSYMEQRQCEDGSPISPEATESPVSIEEYIPFIQPFEESMGFETWNTSLKEDYNY